MDVTPDVVDESTQPYLRVGCTLAILAYLSVICVDNVFRSTKICVLLLIMTVTTAYAFCVVNDMRPISICGTVIQVI